MSAYAAVERLFDLTSDFQDVRHHQSTSPERNKNSFLSSFKGTEGDKRPIRDRMPYQSCKGDKCASGKGFNKQKPESKTALGEGFRKNEGHTNALSQMSSDYWIFSTVMLVDIRQLNGFKRISAMQLDKSLIREEPTSVAILLEALVKPGEIVSKDTMCVLEKCHGVMPNSWPKSLPP
ncbi:RNA-directed DNA polymerase-like protein [Cucumis melo var. makuwa]|uniref:RNA-directed DNA polymerase-like protein n=1 Tax=Cucumis melo var. makuwa TaxID=1194695 RepID=A0A5A7STX3_CUCMM|nr:RNA-directed DNA polymerase-like protein [Cucumis melo var. makuwa]TYK02591.1 RNA-directed DNA polymerase-like protein [Cucumis melo var. makuwa]